MAEYWPASNAEPADIAIHKTNYNNIKFNEREFYLL